jgi:hypothetical protein
MTEENDTHPDETPFKWLAWEWHDNPRFVAIMVAGIVLAIVYSRRLGDYGFLLPGALVAALIIKYGVWVHLVRKARMARENARTKKDEQK